jgi:hypothetical protein
MRIQSELAQAMCSIVACYCSGCLAQLTYALFCNCVQSVLVLLCTALCRSYLRLLTHSCAALYFHCVFASMCSCTS